MEVRIMGQGIKGILGTKSKIAIVIILSLFAFSIFFLTNPRDNGVVGTIVSGNADSQKLVKSEKANHYYISFLRYNDDNKMVKLQCTKKEYDFINDEKKQYHILYRLNFFNKRAGKILMLDDKPIMNGDLNIALYKEFKIVQS